LSVFARAFHPQAPRTTRSSMGTLILRSV
jgi:hypothetical protein